MIYSKTRNSIYTFLSSLLFTLFNGVLTFISTRMILVSYGSDFNGINSTANHLIALLLIVEGGVTLATNVALFRPVSNKDIQKINEILSATKAIFHRIGLVFILLGVLGALPYVLLIRSDIQRSQIYLLFILTIIPAGFNIYYTSKFVVLFQAEQKEYVIHLVNIVNIAVSQSLIIFLAYKNFNFQYIRLAQLVCSILASFFVGKICRSKHPYLDFRVPADYSSIKGTKDVLVQKVTSLIYGTAPVLYISIAMGSVYVSVYAIYNSIFALVKSIIYSLVNAPRMSFGVLLIEKEKQFVKCYFLAYEFVIFTVSSIVFSSVYIMVIPFMKIYTTGINDVSYIDSRIALILSLIGIFEISHIPSGHIINLSGNFRVSKIAQLVAIAVLAITIPIFSYYWGIVGVLLGILTTAIILAFLELGYIHIFFFENSFLIMFKMLLTNVCVGLLLCAIEYQYIPEISTYLDFFLIGTIILFLNSIFILTINFILNRQIFIEIIKLLRILRIFEKFIH